MSDQNAVWPDGAREAVHGAMLVTRWSAPHGVLADAILTALEPFVQQRIAEEIKDIDGTTQELAAMTAEALNARDLLKQQLHEAETRNGITGGVYAELYALRAEVARLREDGERLRAAAVDAINAVSDPAMGHLFRAVDAYDAARSAPGGEG